MTMGDRIRNLRKQRGLTLEEVGRACGVSKSTVRKWEIGMIDSMRADKVQKLVEILDTTIDYLLDGTPTPTIYKNIEPMPPMKVVPILGDIACGRPALAEENYEGTAVVDERVHADFALRCVGDSMINAHIFDGDLVFIRQQPDVDNGQIAAVVIDNEATLKRVYKYRNRVELRPENPLFPVIEYEGEEMAAVHILGKAVAFLGAVR
jgi:repressor LexA